MSSAAADSVIADPPTVGGLHEALREADIVRIDLGDLAQQGEAAASLLDAIASYRRPGILAVRVALDCCSPQAALLAAHAVDRLEILIAHRTAASGDAGLKSQALLSLMESVNATAKARVRAVFEVSAQNMAQLARLVDLAAGAGFFDVRFEPIFVTDERRIEDSVFFDRAAFNAHLDEAMKAGKRRNIFVDAVKFGSQGHATSNPIGARRQVVFLFAQDRPRSDAWLTNRGKQIASVEVGGLEMPAVAAEFRHMDVEEDHFSAKALEGKLFLDRKGESQVDAAFLKSYGPLLKRFGLDAALYLDQSKLLGIRLADAKTSDEQAVAAMNEAIETGFFRSGRSADQRVSIDLTKPFLGINWGMARQNLLPDQRQFWRTFNQWQLPTVFAAVETGRDYVVRSVIHNATPGDAIEFLQLSCNGFVPEQQAINWEGFNCVHVCAVPARVVNDAAGKLCLSFAMTRQSDGAVPAEIGLRTVTIEAVAATPEGSVLGKALSRLHSYIKLKPAIAPGSSERRMGFGRVVPLAKDPTLDVGHPRSTEILREIEALDTVEDGRHAAIASFAAHLADEIADGDLAAAAARVIASTKEIVEKRLDWIRFPPVEHRYADTSVAYEFLAVLGKALRRRLPGGEVRGLFNALLEKNPDSRPALLAVADLHLVAGSYDEAIEAARSAVRRDACCVVSQDILRKIYRAKFPDAKDSVIDGVPLYDLSNRFCSVPFDRIETAKDGIVWTCCPAWLGAPIGNMHRNAWEAAWNSNQAGLMRESILDGTFKYCNGGVCPAILSGELPKKSEVSDPYFRHYIDNNIVKPSEGPREVSISHDPSCNLACPQCRNDFILADDQKNAEYDGTIDNFIKPLIEYAQIDRSTIFMSGDGEIFVSPHYRKILELFDPVKHADVGILLLSNGLLFETGWRKVPNIHKLVRSVTISTDAASESVFSETRGGSWEKLYRNLQFVGELRRSGEINRFSINYAVQTCNYKDMRRMIEIGHELHVDRIAFAILRNSGVYNHADYAKRCIFDASHPDHADFVKELEDPIFRSPIVDIRQFIGFRSDIVVG